MKKCVFAALVAVAFAAPASAQFYVEAHAGWDRVSAAGGHDDGVLYGGAVGYDMPLGASGAFIGIQGNIDGSSTKECVGDVLTIGDRACIKAGRDLSAVARIGYGLAMGKIYALAGYTNARVRGTYNDGAGFSDSAGESLDGYRLGAGFQFPLAPRFYGKVEYRYSRYKQDDLDVHVNRHNVLGGVGFQF